MSTGVSFHVGTPRILPRAFAENSQTRSTLILAKVSLFKDSYSHKQISLRIVLYMGKKLKYSVQGSGMTFQISLLRSRFQKANLAIMG